MVRIASLVLCTFSFATTAEEMSTEDLDKFCAVPPERTSYRPKLRTALASHPRTGSTWTRFLLERATGKPCGFEKTVWANVLRHVGEDPRAPHKPNMDGIITKTHSICAGCWLGADVLNDRLTIEGNSTLSEKDLRQSLGDVFVKKLAEHGHCLENAESFFDARLRRFHNQAKREGQGGVKGRRKTTYDEFVCEFMYDQAIILMRDPLDTLRSNYHYRSMVLKMPPEGTWSENNYSFPQERGESFTRFYRAWEKFAAVKPALYVHFEDLKADTPKQLRRMIEFLGLEVHEAKIQCAVNMSAIDKLKEMKAVGHLVQTDTFFGTRDKTEAQEDLSYPQSLIDHLDSYGLFDAVRPYGYDIQKETALEKYNAKYQNAKMVEEAKSTSEL